MRSLEPFALNDKVWIVSMLQSIVGLVARPEFKAQEVAELTESASLPHKFREAISTNLYGWQNVILALGALSSEPGLGFRAKDIHDMIYRQLHLSMNITNAARPAVEDEFVTVEDLSARRRLYRLTSLGLSQAMKIARRME